MQYLEKPLPKVAAFSLVELVIALIVIGILAAVAAPKFFNSNSAKGRSAAAELVVRLKFAQQLAMNNTSRTTSAVVTATQIDILQDSTSISGYPYDFSNDYSNVTFSNANLTFNSMGETSSATITVTPSSGVNVCVEASGYAWLC